MNGFIKWFDGLNFSVKVILAVIPVAHFILVVYQLIRDSEKQNNGVELVLDIVFGLILFVVSYILNIIWILQYKTPVSYKELFNIK